MCYSGFQFYWIGFGGRCTKMASSERSQAINPHCVDGGVGVCGGFWIYKQFAAKSSTVEVNWHTAGTTPQYLVPIMAMFSK